MNPHVAAVQGLKESCVDPRKGLAVIGLVLCISAACLAAEQRISSVNVTGLAGDELTQAQRAVKVRAGDVYSPRALQDDVMSLLGLSFVQSARAKESVTPTGVDVVYDVAVKGKLTGISFAGNKRLKAKKLREIGNLKDMNYYDLAKLSEARQAIIDKYKKSGYLFAKAEFASQPDGSVLFTIDEGPRMKVAQVHVIGNTAFSDAVLKKNVKTRTRRWLILPYRLDEDVLEEDRVKLQDFYRDAGYLDADVKVTFSLDRTGRGIIVDYVVTEGPLYTVRGITVTGNSIVPTYALTAPLKMTMGKPFSSARAEKDVAAMKAVYGRIGYIDTQIIVTPLFSEQGTEVDVNYRVTEGGEVYIREVEIYGNDKTRDNVIRRELEFFPGEKFNTGKIEESKKNLERLGYFSKVEIGPDARTPGASKRDAVVSVEEKTTGQFIIGVGVSSNAGLIGQIALIQNNYDWRKAPRGWRDIVEGKAWAGGGQYFEINASPGTKLSQLRFAFRNPRVNDSRYSFGFGAHLWQRDWETYTERRLGADVSVGRQMTKNSFWETTFATDIVKISGIDKDAPRDVKNVRGRHVVNTLGLTVGHDTRDNFLVPTMGHRITGTVEVSNRAIGSDFNFQRFIVDGNWYRLTHRDELDRPFVVSLRGRVGYMAGNVPIFERLYAGGAGDIRGFEYRGVGPRAGETPLGGRFLTTGGIQYEFPLAADVLRGDVFYDAGAVFRTAEDFRLNRIRHAVGFGFKIVIPPPLNLPIAIDFGFPIKKERSDETQLVSFSIGRLL